MDELESIRKRHAAMSGPLTPAQRDRGVLLGLLDKAMSQKKVTKKASKKKA